MYFVFRLVKLKNLITQTNDNLLVGIKLKGYMRK